MQVEGKPNQCSHGVVEPEVSSTIPSSQGIFSTGYGQQFPMFILVDLGYISQLITGTLPHVLLEHQGLALATGFRKTEKIFATLDNSTITCSCE